MKAETGGGGKPGAGKGCPAILWRGGGRERGRGKEALHFMEGSPFRCRCPSRGGPMRGVAVYTRILAKDLAEACPHWEAVPGGGPCLRGAGRGPHSGICVDVGGLQKGKGGTPPVSRDRWVAGAFQLEGQPSDDPPEPAYPPVDTEGFEIRAFDHDVGEVAVFRLEQPAARGALDALDEQLLPEAHEEDVPVP